MLHNSDTDLGITPGKGLVPPKISASEIDATGMLLAEVYE